MTEITGKRTQTIHSLLQYDFKTLSFRKNHEDPIDCDLVIVDESGMIDTILLQRFLAALPDHAILILIGDVHQLPSVGPGNVLKDLILSHHIEVTYLTKIFRQLQNSNIITNAHKVNQGEFPVLNSSSGKKTFYFFKKKTLKKRLNTSFISFRILFLKIWYLYQRYSSPCSHEKRGIRNTQSK